MIVVIAIDPTKLSNIDRAYEFSTDKSDTLFPPSQYSYQMFGAAISAYGDKVLISAPGPQAYLQVDHDSYGIVYLYRHSDVNDWEMISMLSPHVTVSDGFGAAVSLQADLALIGMCLSVSCLSHSIFFIKYLWINLLIPHKIHVS